MNVCHMPVALFLKWMEALPVNLRRNHDSVYRRLATILNPRSSRTDGQTTPLRQYRLNTAYGDRRPCKYETYFLTRTVSAI